jgi:hypothetical protein
MSPRFGHSPLSREKCSHGETIDNFHRVSKTPWSHSTSEFATSPSHDVETSVTAADILSGNGNRCSLGSRRSGRDIGTWTITKSWTWSSLSIHLGVCDVKGRLASGKSYAALQAKVSGHAARVLGLGFRGREACAWARGTMTREISMCRLQSATSNTNFGHQWSRARKR